MGFTYPKPRPWRPQKVPDRYRIGGKHKCQPRTQILLQVENDPIKSLPQQTAYLPKTFNRCQDSISDSEGNKKQIESTKLYFKIYISYQHVRVKWLHKNTVNKLLR